MKEIIPTFESYLFEDPDRVIANNVKVQFQDESSLPFGYYDDKMLIGDYSEMHDTLVPGKYRKDLQSPGRVWVDKKIISFWTIDRPIKKIIDDINKLAATAGKNKFKIDKTWNIDVSMFSLVKALGPRESGMLKPLSDVLRDAPKGQADSYTVEWEDIVNEL
jgi:hypothetical protein